MKALRKKEALAFFAYMMEFKRRRGWRTKPCDVREFRSDSVYEIRGVTACATGSNEDLKYLEFYRIRITISKREQFEIPLAHLIRIKSYAFSFNPYRLKRNDVFTVSLVGAIPFKVTGQRGLIIRVAIIGVKVFPLARTDSRKSPDSQMKETGAE